MYIVAEKINIYCQARTSKQRQRASTDQNQAGGRRDSFSEGLQDGLDFGVVHD
jgi:hypothetical protein